MRDQDDVSKRKVLKTTGAALAAAVGSTTVTAAPGKADPELIAVAKGRPNSPVSASRIEKLQQKVLANGAAKHDVDEVVTNDTKTELAEYKRRSESTAKDILGYGIAWTDGSPTITIQHLPKGVPASEAQLPTERAPKKVDNFAKAHRNND